VARPVDDDAGSPVRRPHAPDPESAVVLTPEGKQRLLARAARLASEPDQAGWGNDGYSREATELAHLHSILGQAITTEELPPGQPGVVELGDEVTVEFTAGESERFLLVHPVEAPLDQLRISVQSPLARALLGRRVGEQVEVQAPGGRYRCRILAARRFPASPAKDRGTA
jgi:Transcription elongation factor, GreA/GreB, C-term